MMVQRFSTGFLFVMFNILTFSLLVRVSSVSAFPQEQQFSNQRVDLAHTPLTPDNNLLIFRPFGTLVEDAFAIIQLPEEEVLHGGTVTLNFSELFGAVLEPEHMGQSRQDVHPLGARELPQYLLSKADSEKGSFCEAKGYGLRGADKYSEGEVYFQGDMPIVFESGKRIETQVYIGLLNSSSSDSIPSPRCRESDRLEESASDSSRNSRSDETEWCISWFSTQCKRKRTSRGEKECNQGARCAVSYSRLLSWALASPSNIVANCAQFGATALLARCLEEYGIGWGGYCSEVYFLGFIPAGCQCVLT